MKTPASRWLLFLGIVACVPIAAAASYAKKAPQNRESVNSIGMTLVQIPAGEFQMGATEPPEKLVETFAVYRRKPDFFKDEYPRHRVRITRPFEFGKYEITVGQFRKFVEDAGYKTEAERDGTGGWGYNSTTGKCEGRSLKYNWHDPGFEQTDDHPVLNVTWNDAAAFCKWLSRKEGKNYRLPTEAEWEYAARAGATTRYADGDDPAGLAKKANVRDDAGLTKFPHVQELDIPPSGSPKFTEPVGRFPPNRFGLCDMSGNVWEWCSDWYGADYYAHSPAEDPQGPEKGDRRVRRGGGWNSFPLWARAAFRNWNTPKSRCVNLGFRVVCDQAVTLVFGGDVMLDGGPGHAIVYGRDPFADFAPLLRGADLSVCNLECVVADGGEVFHKSYTFRGPRQAVPLLKRYFSAVCLANNHTGDFGPEAFVKQRRLLNDAGVPCFGGGLDSRQARRPVILERRGLRVALLGYSAIGPRVFRAGEKSPGAAWLVEDEAVEDIRAARQKADIVIPFIHWGRELSAVPTQRQQQIARRLIDAGATAVIGGHPHVVQTVETYRGRPIVYSLGNFVFDYFPADPPVWTGWLVRLTIERSGAVGLEKFSCEIDPVGIPHPKQ
jgi:formylglycine-generating enzyme